MIGRCVEGAGRAVALGMLACCLVGVKSSCKSTKRQLMNPSEGLSGGVLVFSDDFERKEPGDRWLNRSGKWNIADGMLHGRGDRNEGLWLNEPLHGRVRVEFDARADSAEGDLKFEIFASEQRHQTGYVVIMGGWNNTISIIARLDEHGSDRLEAEIKVEVGRTYHITIVRTDNALRWYIDGTLSMQFRDEEPLRGRYFGFNDWNAPVSFDNLEIYQL